MISRSIIQFSVLYIFFQCHCFALNFILILCHLQVTSYENRITWLHDYIILGFKQYRIKFIYDYIMLESMYYNNNSFIMVSVIANGN